jgi:hypothetical protein
MHKLASLASAVLVSGAALGVAVLAPAHADAPTDRQNVAGGANATLAQVRDSLRPLQHSPASAQAAGYRPADVCVASPDGGMGYHYVNPLLAVQAPDPLHPSVLVYVPGKDGRLTLAAAEWFQADADQDVSTDGDRPTLFGRPFDGPMTGHEPGMPTHYDLHAWLFTPNPAGVFAPWNPAVTCPPQS